MFVFIEHPRMSTGVIEEYYIRNDIDRMVSLFPLEVRQSHVDKLLREFKESNEDWIRLVSDERNVPATPDTIAARVSNRRRSAQKA